MFGIKSKKGFAYVVIISIFVAVLLVVFLTYNSFSYVDNQQLHEERILTMNNFVKDFNEDIHRATFISSYRALVALEDNIALTGSFVNDTENVFKEIFYNGSLNGDSILIMNGSSFSEYVNRVNALAGNIGIVANITVDNITLNQSDPWLITVGVLATVNVSDYRNTATWSYQEEYVTNLPILNLRDPVYSYYTGNKVPNTIRISPYVNLVESGNATNLETHIREGYYVASNKSPSFLQRFEGNLSPHEFGIESIVDLEDLSGQEITVYTDRIKVDYMYFTNAAGSKLCDVENVSSSLYFVVTDDRVDLYQLSGLNYSTTCP